MGGSGYRRRRRRDAADAAKLAMDGVFVSFSLPLSGGLHGHLLKHSGSSTQEERAPAEAAAAKLQPPSLLPRGGYAHAAKKAAAAAAAAKFAAKKATAAAAAAKLATQKAVAEAAAAVKAQEEEAACPFYELALWHLEVGKGNGKVGSAVKHTTPVSQHLEFRQAAKVRHVVNSVLQTAYEQKKKALAARLGAANVNEQFLFHGTSMANSDGIIHSNFKLSKVRTPSRCRCCALVVNKRLFFLIILTHRTRVRSNE
jgi:hypothetical protein